MKDLFFFDADCRLGKGPNCEIRPSVSDTLAEMDKFGIDKALVRHNNIAMCGALESNRDLAAMLKQDESNRLVGIWSILPSQCHEIPEPDQFFREMKANKIGAIALYPYEHRYVPCRLSIGKMMDAAAERKIPVILNGFGDGHWEDLYRFVETFQNNVLIYFDNVGKWGHDRQVRPLLEAYGNFHYGITGYWVPQGILDFVREYGAERFLYSSGFPFYLFGSGMTQLKHSGITMEEVAKIAGRNLETLLKGAQL